jgi:hypothetical protein
MKMAIKKQCGPDETACPAGCCPEANWFCCPDNMYCAATEADCPFVKASHKLMKMAIKKQCGPDETACPAGCCPEANWFCCPDNMYCAATEADCPFVKASHKLMKMAIKKQCGPDETACPAGCCPEANWFCCPDNMYCAATAADCPFVKASHKLMKMAIKKQCGPDETACPAGCCPEANWFCCPDNMYCAATAADCPFVSVQKQLRKMFSGLKHH